MDIDAISIPEAIDTVVPIMLHHDRDEVSSCPLQLALSESVSTESWKSFRS